MNAKAEMKAVDGLLNDISTRVGTLTKLGFFTFEEGMKIIRAISDKESEWMKSNFSDMEIYEFMKSK